MISKDIWTFLEQQFQNGQHCLLFIVVSSNQPSPGATGFKMAVSSNGQFSGTVGGGRVEKMILQAAWSFFTKRTSLPVAIEWIHAENLSKQVRQVHLQSSTMICGGVQTICHLLLDPTKITLIKKIKNRFRSKKPFAIAWRRNSIEFKKLSPASKNSFQLKADNDFLFLEVYKPPPVYIIGAGHVALALSAILNRLEFRLTLIDENLQRPTARQNCFVHQKIEIPFEKVSTVIPHNEDNYLLIMTPDHCTDQIVLEQLLNYPAKYLGMLASIPKVEQIFSSLKQKGFRPEQLQRLHAPIGLPINSTTPEEIAISIAAEMIQIKNNEQKKP